MIKGLQMHVSGLFKGKKMYILIISKRTKTHHIMWTSEDKRVFIHTGTNPY